MNVPKLSGFFFRMLFAVLLVVGGLFLLSLVAVTFSFANYNAPIVPVCPVSEGSNSMVAVDADGRVMNATISDGWNPNITVGEIVAPANVGDPLTVQINIFDTIDEGNYRIALTFANDDKPIPQTATCRLVVNVIKNTSLTGETRTFYSIKSRERQRRSSDLARSLIRKVGLGMVPGLLAVVMVAWGSERFLHAVYGLDNLGGGLLFLIHRIFGRSTTKKPSLPVVKGKVGDGDEILQKLGGPGSLFVRKDNSSAVILEQAGKLTRVFRGPAFPILKPFEKVWDVIDLRPQRWVYTVPAITQDGIPIEYEADVQFQIGDTDEDIFKAATCKWIRDAERTEPDRLMIWTKRVVIGAMEGTLRAILSHHDLDDLLDTEVRQDINKQLRDSLTESAANNFGVNVLDVTLRDIKFDGQILQQWFEQWQAKRDREVQRIRTKGEVDRIQARQQARSAVQQQMLDKTVEILNVMVEEYPEAAEHRTQDYIMLSFIEMMMWMSINNPFSEPDKIVKTLENIRMNYRLRGQGSRK